MERRAWVGVLRAHPALTDGAIGAATGAIVGMGTLTQRGTTVDALLAAGSLAVAAALAVTWSARRRRARRVREQHAFLEQRLAIARELHDVVAHHVSLIGVQAAAARRVQPTRPDEAAALLEAIEASSRAAVSEMGRLVTTLREPAEVPSADPAPTLASVTELIARARAAGLPIEARIAAFGPRELPPTMELTIVRIVQEALTNVLRHAGTAATSVLVDRDADAVRVVVENGPPRDSAASPARSVLTTPGTGAGLRGMRERAGVFGGAVDAGPTEAGGYRLAVRLPLPGDRP